MTYLAPACSVTNFGKWNGRHISILKKSKAMSKNNFKCLLIYIRFHSLFFHPYPAINISEDPQSQVSADQWPSTTESTTELTLSDGSDFNTYFDLATYL